MKFTLNHDDISKFEDLSFNDLDIDTLYQIVSSQNSFYQHCFCILIQTDAITNKCLLLVFHSPKDTNSRNIFGEEYCTLQRMKFRLIPIKTLNVEFHF